jgi:hypothetical protein
VAGVGEGADAAVESYGTGNHGGVGEVVESMRTAAVMSIGERRS